MFKKILIYFLLILSCLVVLSVVLWGFFRLGPGNNLIRRSVEKQLGTVLQQEVQIGKVETNLLSRIRFKDIRFYSIQPIRSQPLLEIALVSIQYRAFDLLQKRLNLSKIQVDGLHIFVQRDSLGKFNLPGQNSRQAASGDSSMSRFVLRIGDVQVQNSSVEYQDRTIPLAANIRNLQIESKAVTDEVHSFRIKSDSVQFRYQEMPVTGRQLDLSGTLCPDSLRLSTLRLQLPGLTLSGAGGIQWQGIPSLQGNFFLSGRIDEVMRIAAPLMPTELMPIHSTVELAVSIAGAMHDPQISGQLRFPRLQIADWEAQNGMIEMTYHSGTMAFHRLQFEMFNGFVDGSGDCSIDSLIARSIHFQIKNIDINRLWHAAYRQSSPFEGKMSGFFTLTGNLSSLAGWQVEADLLLYKLVYQEKAIPDIESKLSIQNGVAQLDFKQGDSQAFLDVQLRKAQLSGQFSARINEIEPLAGLAHFPELSGKFECSGTIAGTQLSPIIDSQLLCRDIHYQNFPIDSIRGRLHYSNRHFLLNNTRFSGHFDVVDSIRAPFHLTGFRGGVRYQGWAEGLLDSLRLEAQAELVAPGYDNFSFAHGTMQIQLAHQRARTWLTLSRDSVQMRLKGEYQLTTAKGMLETEIVSLSADQQQSDNWQNKQSTEKQFSSVQSRLVGRLTANFDLSDLTNLYLQARGEQIDISSIQSFRSDSLNVGGQLDFSFRFRGSAKNPSANATVLIRNPRFELFALDSVRANIHLEDAQINLSKFEFYVKDQYSWLEAGIGLQRNQNGSLVVASDSPIWGKAAADELDLRILSPFIPRPFRISGQSTYNLVWQGTFSKPQISGIFKLQNGELQQGTKSPLLRQISVSAALADSVLTFTDTGGLLGNTPWNLAGKITVRHWQSYDLDASLVLANTAKLAAKGIIYPESLQVNSEIRGMNLSFLQPFFPAISDLQGELNLTAALFGPIKDLQLDGQLTLQNLSLKLPNLDIGIQSGVLKTRFNQQDVYIDSLFCRVNDGTVFLAGSVTHDLGRLVDVDLKANLQRIKINRPKQALVDITSAQFDYKKQNNTFLLDGDVILGEAKIMYNLRPQMFFSFTQAVQRPQQELPLLLQQTRLNVRIRESDIWIDNNLARLRLHSELGIIGTPANPNLSGRLTLAEGYILYLDRKFKITKGTIDFINPNQLNPIIDLESQASLKSYQTLQGTTYIITLSILGPLDQAVVNLTSEPPLEKPDIVSLLTIGATRGQLTSSRVDGKESSVSAVLLDRAKSLSSDRVSGYAAHKLGDLFGLEKMTIEGNVFQFDKNWGPQLLASKKFSNRITLTYTTTVGHMNEQGVRLDYQLTKRLSVEGQSDQQGRSMIDLKYRLKFK